MKIEVKEWFKDLHSVYYESIYRLQSSQSIFVGNLFLLLHSFNKYLRVWYSSQQTFSKKGQMVKFKLCGVHMVPVMTFCDPMHDSLPASSVHGILQARIVECIAVPPLGDLPSPGIKPASLKSPALAGGLFATSTTWETPSYSWSRLRWSYRFCPFFY